MQRYRFGEFELDLDAQQLRRNGEAVHLERRPFDLLVLLVTAEGRVVSREDIIQKLWPARVIIDFEAGVNTLVRKVRSALGDSAEAPAYIETVAGKGYRFVAPLAEPAEPPARSRPHPRAILLLVLVLAAGATLLAWWLVEPLPGHTRIAVLPLENLSGDPKLDYMAAGIAEETSIALAQIDVPELSVIGAISARALAASDLSLRELGRDLGVDYVVVSSLRQGESRMRVTSRLLRVSDGTQVWSASFDRELTNVLALQRELSIAIAEQVRQRLSPELTASLSRRQTENPEAYRLYLQGRYAWTQFRPDSVEKAIGYYRQAVARDPRYGLAWAGIAHALITSTVTRGQHHEALQADAQEALQFALEYGSELAETQLALGAFHFFLDRNLAPAEEAARKAVVLDPNSAMSHMFLGVVLSQAGKHVEAAAMTRRARELDPLFPLMFANSATVALSAGEPQDALEYARQAVAINPDFWVGYLHLARAQRALGDYDAALEAYAHAEKLAGGNLARATSDRAGLLARLGRDGEARGLLEQLLARAAEQYVPPFYLAAVYAELGDDDPALEWLERAVTTSSISCSTLEDDARLEGLRADARFEPLTRHCRTDLAWDDAD